MRAVKPDDDRPKRKGWAPGGYWCSCADCGQQFTGDKRAIQCADCAHVDVPRIYKDGEARFMCRSDGYVMARKPRCVPFVIHEKEWLALPAYK